MYLVQCSHMSPGNHDCSFASLVENFSKRIVVSWIFVKVNKLLVDLLMTM